MNTGLYGPYNLDNENIDTHVIGTGPGAYALGYVNNGGGLAVLYIGRSDDDLNGRLKNHIGEKYSSFKYIFYRTAKDAYNKECQLWHSFGGERLLENKIHPDKGINKDWVCPICGV